jgi:hypothetical protein
MRRPTLDSGLLLKLLLKRKIATLDELKTTLGTGSTMTVFRKLKQLEYVSSCSHSGQYYTLKRIATFNQEGLWFCHNVLFSAHASLKETIKALIENSPQGYTAIEIKQILGIEPNGPLVELATHKTICRNKISGRYIYFSKNASQRTRQELFRRDAIEVEMPNRVKANVLPNEVKATILLFYSSLNEKERRLYAGLESIKIGRGGDKAISELFGIDRKTIARGRNELLGDTTDIEGIRQKGAGRKSIKKKRRDRGH